MTTLKKRGSGGRPPLNRDRHTYRPRLDLDVAEALSDQASRMGLQMGTYLEHVLAAAHGYHGPYMQNLDAPLPIALPLARLRRRTRAITRDHCRSASSVNVLKPIRVDLPLANEIQERCEALGDVAYSDYIRAILDLAVGRTASSRGVQATLSDDLMGGAVRRRSA